MISILMHIVSILGSFIVAFAGTAYFFNEMEIFIQLILGLVLATIAILILRAIFRKERPNIHSLQKGFLHHRMTRSRMRGLRDKLIELEKRSFASAHVARIAVYLSVLYLNNYPYEWLISLLGLMVLVGVARLYLKRHRFFDVFTGAAVGLAAGYLAFFLFNLYF